MIEGSVSYTVMVIWSTVTHGSLRCSMAGTQQWFVLKNLNAASSVYHVKLRAVNGHGAGPASAIIAVSTVLPGLTSVTLLVTNITLSIAHLHSHLCLFMSVWIYLLDFWCYINGCCKIWCIMCTALKETMQCCLQCFDTVGWVAGRASGL